MQLFNTQSGKLERLTARDGKIGLYVCGVTPYDTTHAGHAFTYLTFDVLVRYLRFSDFDVTYVQNVTDIDDDILRKAKELGTTWDQLGRSETERFRTDLRDLNALDPGHYVLATDHIPEIVAIAQALVESGHAYESNGSVYFSVASDPNFGTLSHLDREDMLPVANERGNNPDDPDKRDPLDFVLWQAAKPGEPTWESPWGPGRPGWHIECSAMATRYLGPTVDIHGGGSDLIFPHHECEIAQTEPVTGERPYVRYWMHTGMVEYQGEKMSKSLGNLVLAPKLLDEGRSPDAIKLCLLSHRYRDAWDYEDSAIVAGQELADLLRAAASDDGSTAGAPSGIDTADIRARFDTAMDDDLDTPAVLPILRDLAEQIQAARAQGNDASAARVLLRELGRDVLGLTLK